MKKMLFFVAAGLILLSLTACGNKDGNVSDEDTTATEPVYSDSYVEIEPEMLDQPENALKQQITGNILCYLDYAVQTPSFTECVDKAVTSTVIDGAAAFDSFFEENQVNGVGAAEELHNEMLLTDTGKSLYQNEEFYKIWNLVILSVRESSADSTLDITAVDFNSDASALHFDGIRNIADDGNTSVRQYVLRVPVGSYFSISHTFEAAE